MCTVLASRDGLRLYWSGLGRWFAGVTASPPIQGYRPDVDGLRAVAVMSVVVFHLSPRLAPGGFVGVDIFFVISGYLISSILFKEHAAGRFSFAEFYGRRIRRLGPALVVVLVACLAFGWFFLISGEYKSLGRHTAVSALFGSNILLFNEVDYFAGAAGEKPLLHLWSLGIEEQFYLFWPLLLWVAWRHLPRLSWLLVSGIVLSFAACVLTTTRAGSAAAFYLPQSRCWELLVGALIAYHSAPRFASGSPAADSPPAWLASHCRQAGAWAGLGLIAVPLYAMNAGSTFPGWRAAVPVAGAAALISAGPSTWVNRRLLGNRAMTGVGLLAYPIYLWHWPLFVFVRLAGGGRSVRVMALVATMALAWLTKVAVEDPIRFGRWSRKTRRHLTAAALLGALIIVGAAGFFVDRAGGFPSRYPPDLWPLEDDPVAFPCLLTPEQGPEGFPASCAGLTGPAGSMLLWGDSYAAHLEQGLRQLDPDRGLALNVYAASACPAIVGVDFDRRPRCRGINDFVLARIRELRPRTVVLAAHWMLYGDVVSRQVERTIEAVRDSGVRHVILVGPIPSWPTALPGILARSATLSGVKAVPARLANAEVLPAHGLDRVMNDLAAQAGADYVSLTDILCNQDGSCLTLVPGHGMTPMQFDTGHLTSEGSRYAVRQIASHIAIP